MGTKSLDTRPDPQHLQVGLLRNAGVARRVGLVRSLSSTVICLSRRAIRRRHPDLSEDEVSLEFVAIHYGRDLADGLSACLQRRRK